MCLALPGRLESIRDEAGTRMGRMDFGGVVKEVCLACLPDLMPGDYAIVHAGFAIARIDEAAAEATLDVLAAIDSPASLEDRLDVTAAVDGGPAPLEGLASLAKASNRAVAPREEAR